MTKSRAARHPAGVHEKEMVSLVTDMSRDRQIWQTWQDMVTAMACSISNAIDRTEGHFEKREKEYAGCIERLGGAEKPARALAVVVEALERDPGQDFLGKIYMDLNLGSHWTGQFFTPYGVCRVMSQISVGDVDEQIEGQGHISVCDPACGAGATLIAAANTMKSSKYNFQDHVLFVGQDVDRVAAQMCYIQLSLLGCAGYVCVGNTLTDPLGGHVLFPQEKESQELWYMPMFQSDTWHWRRAFKALEGMCGTVATKKAVEKECYFMSLDQIDRRQEMEGVNLQSPKVRERMERDAKVKHFTIEPRPDNGYGETWGAVVQAYLKDGYKAEGDVKEITVAGILYKMLVRTRDTVFYDADGSTLFDVENERLDREYEQLMDAPKETGAGAGCQIKDQIDKTGETDLGCSGGIDKKCMDCDRYADPENEGAGQGVADTPKTMAEDKVGGGVSDGETHIAEKVSMKQGAKEKLEKELESTEDKSFAGYVIRYLLGRCAEDEGLSRDVVQEHKTWEKCLVYIQGQAKAQIQKDGRSVQGVIGVHVCDETAYEWAEDYYHKDDKAEEAEKARKEAERKERQKKETAGRAAKAKKRPSKTAAGPKKKADAPREQPRPKKDNKDMEGQLDMFSMMGM